MAEQQLGEARPLETLKVDCGRPDWERITELLDKWQPVLLVVGMPLDMDGGEQPMSKRARRFGNQLAGRYNLPVHWVDERFTSMEAESWLKQHQGHFSKEEVDQHAARLILQSWLEGQP